MPQNGISKYLLKKLEPAFSNQSGITPPKNLVKHSELYHEKYIKQNYNNTFNINYKNLRFINN